MRYASTIRRSECGKGRGRNRTPSTMEKIAVVAPIPKASISTAVAVKPGDCLNCRKTNFKSRKNERMGGSSAKDCYPLIAFSRPYRLGKLNVEGSEPLWRVCTGSRYGLQPVHKCEEIIRPSGPEVGSPRPESASASGGN